MTAPSPIDLAMQKAVADGVFPGASLLVARGEDVLYRNFFGHQTLLPSPEPATAETLWDIASLTKPVATASLILRAIVETGLAIDSPLTDYFPGFDDAERKKITVRHLLEHTSGLPAWKPYFKEWEAEHASHASRREARAYYFKKISKEPLEQAPGAKRVYSDLGFILLGFLLESLFEKDLSQIFEDKIASVLALKNTFFQKRNAGSRSPDRFAATEQSPGRGLIRGEVHDDNAYALGGISGHAGLFSHVDDLRVFLSSVSQSYREGTGLFPKEILKSFVDQSVVPRLGWDFPEPPHSQAGRFFSANTIGHLGDAGS